MRPVYAEGDDRGNAEADRKEWIHAAEATEPNGTMETMAAAETSGE